MTLSLARLAALEPPCTTLDALEAHAFHHGPGASVDAFGDRYELHVAGRVVAWAPLGATA